MGYHILLLGILWCTVNIVSAQNDTSLGIEEFTLDNGLKIIVQEDHRAPVAISQIWYKVGGSYEHDGITGISHVLEHMMFKGTVKHPAGEFSRIIASHGGQQNAFTAPDYTAYYQQVAASQLPLCLELEADRMNNLTLSNEEFSKEINVVLEEQRQRVEDKPEGRAKQRFFAGAYVNNPYRHPTIGWLGDILNTSTEDVRAWYKRWYGPNNAILVVVGDVSSKEVFKLAQQYFGKIDPIQILKQKPELEEQPLGERRLEINIPTQTPHLFMGYNVPCVFSAEEFWEPYALTVLIKALDGGNSSRFSQHLIRGKSVAADIDSWYNPFQLHSTVMTFFSTPTEGISFEILEQAFLEEIFHLQTELMSESELKRIKIKAIAEHIFGRDSMSNQAREFGALEAVGLSWQLSDAYVDLIQAITKEQVQAVAKKYLIKQRLIIAKLIPKSET